METHKQTFPEGPYPLVGVYVREGLEESMFRVLGPHLEQDLDNIQRAGYRATRDPGDTSGEKILPEGHSIVLLCFTHCANIFLQTVCLGERERR